MLRHAMVSEMPDGLSVQPPASPRKIGCPVYHIFITCSIYPRMYVHAQGGKGESWGAYFHSTKIPVWNFVNPTCPMEQYILVAQTQPKPQHVIVLVSRIQKSGTRENNFVKWRGTFWSDRPKWPDKSKWTTFRAGHEYSGQTKLKWTIPFDQPTKISGILGWKEIKRPWTPLSGGY